MKNLLTKRIAEGLTRKTASTCSKWAELYRVMPQGKWVFDDYPWTREMHDCENEMVVGQKAAQMGFTEMCLNRCLYVIDIKGYSVLYVLPTDGNASDFSTGRFDPALELSPYMRNLFSNVKNIGHKRAGGASLYVRGSRSRSDLKSLPVSEMVFDEVDEMDEKNITLAFERTSGQVARQAWLISTPTIEGKGVNRYFNESTQEHFFFKCPHCNKLTELIFPDCLVITSDDPKDKELYNSHIICKECRQTLDHADKKTFLSKGVWVPKYSDRITRGFHVNQLYSCRLDPWKIASLWITSQSNPSDEQEFYNSKMGVTHAVKGAQLDDKTIDGCLGGYTEAYEATRNTFNTMGIDVGTWLHYEITQYAFSSNDVSLDIHLITRAKVLKVGKVKTFEELEELMIRYNIISCVIDNQPETRLALNFANKFDGYVKLCIYGRGVAGKIIHEHTESEQRITVDRTSWLDVSLGRFKNSSIKLPLNIPLEYKEHLKAPVRVYKKDSNNNSFAVYENVKADHYAHARNYAEIALTLGIKAQEACDISSPI